METKTGWTKDERTRVKLNVPVTLRRGHNKFICKQNKIQGALVHMLMKILWKFGWIPCSGLGGVAD